MRYDIGEAKKYFNNEFIDYHIEFFYNGLNAVIKKWLEGDCKESPEEIENIIKTENKTNLEYELKLKKIEEELIEKNNLNIEYHYGCALEIIDDANEKIVKTDQETIKTKTIILALGRTPNKAAKEDPIPSQITPPESSLSVASRPRPPSITPEISPTVSTAVTTNMIITGMIARRSNTGFTGMILGISNQAAFATLLQLSTQAFVYSTPSAVTAVVGRIKPMITAAT